MGKEGEKKDEEKEGGDEQRRKMRIKVGLRENKKKNKRTKVEVRGKDEKAGGERKDAMESTGENGKMMGRGVEKEGETREGQMRS